MKGSHVHLGVKDLSAALGWFEKVWRLEPTFHNERVAVIPFGDLWLIFDVAAIETTATVGFESESCDDDFRAVVARGGVALEEPKDRPWAPDPPMFRAREGSSSRSSRCSLGSRSI